MNTIRLHYNVLVNYPPKSRTVPHIIAYEFYVLEEEKEIKMDFIEKTIRKYGQFITDVAILKTDSLMISTNSDIEEEIKLQSKG